MTTNKTNNANYTGAMIIVAALFFIFGFVTWLNGTLIPFLKLTCNLDSDAKAFLVTFAFFIAYFVLAIPSSWILEKVGFKNGMSLGLAIMAVGAVIFIPAANSRSFMMFLVGLFVQGMGLALLQTAVNPYVSIIGPIESAATRISIMGIFNKLAGIAAPLVFGKILLGNASEISSSIEAATDPLAKAELLNQLASRIVNPYIIMTVVLMLLAIGLRFTSLPEVNLDNEKSDDETDNKSSIFQYPHAILGALAIFFYVGAEVMAGDIIGTYGKNLGFSLDESKYFTTFTLIGMLIGYVLSLFLIPNFVKQEQWLKISAILGILLTFAAFFTSGSLAVTCIAALGFANAVMWPAIFPLGIDGLGRFTKIGSALLIMGIAGGAIIPQIYGFLSSSIGFEKAFLATMIPCYVFILYFAQSGHKKGRNLI
jgi:glucose/galactose transporter